jgi:hypothetical protein
MMTSWLGHLPVFSGQDTVVAGTRDGDCERSFDTVPDAVRDSSLQRETNVS